MRSLCLGLLGLSLLAGCSPTTPLFIAQIGTQEVVEYKTLKTNRMPAAIEEDGDLLTYSPGHPRQQERPGRNPVPQRLPGQEARRPGTRHRPVPDRPDLHVPL